MKSTTLTLLLILGLTNCAIGQETLPEPERAKPKEGKTIDPPASQNLPEGYESLPKFGAIGWEVHHLPWVTDGPDAGISGTAMATDGLRLLVAGGFIPGGDGTETKKTNRTSHWAWSYDPVTDSWFPLPNMPGRREYTRGVVAAEAFYVLGGGAINQTEEPPYRAYDDVFRLDLTKEKPEWENVASLNVARTHMAVGNVGSKILAIGGNHYEWSEKGYSHKTIRDTNEVYDLEQPDKGWQMQSPIPNGGRGWTGSVTTDDAMYLFGGVTWNKDGKAERFNETWRYLPGDDIWEKKQPAPAQISGWEGALYQNRYALLVGGVIQDTDPEAKNPMVWSDLCWAYDLKEDEWLRIEGYLPPGAVFNDPGVVMFDDTIYVLGAEGPYGSHYNYLLVGHIERDE
ncbi:MAG: hypothetical protein CMJ46_07615 [Planctomyces sp.]|nr:hypothetical protein [Planctomyces sp.]